jgi:hypothetical protein
MLFNARMKYALIVAIIATIGVWTNTLPSALGADLQAPPQKIFPGAFGNNRTFPIVSNGYLLSYRRTVIDNNAPVIFVTSLASGQTVQLPFWIPGAWEISLENGSVNSSGHVALAGSYSTSPSDILSASPDARATNFLAKVDRRGRVVALYDLGQYTAERTCAANDGSVWTFGQVFPMELQHNLSYNMIRHYSPDGSLLDSYFSRSSLVNRRIQYHAQREGGIWASLYCGASSIGAYIGSGSGSFLWIEIDPSTGTTETWTVSTTPYPRILGMALSSKHSLYAGFGSGGLYRLSLDSGGSATWEPASSTLAANTSAPTGSSFVLLGRDGPSLVYLMNNPAPGTDPTLYWSGPVK